MSNIIGKIFSENKLKSNMYTNRDTEVIILTYNREKFLEESVMSIVNQTIGEVQITVVDNASSDGTRAIVEDLMKQYPQIKYYRQNETVPQQENFAKAIELAQKDLVMLFHDDDILHPEYLKLAVAAFNKYPRLAIVSSLCTIISNPTNDNWEEIVSDASLCRNKFEFVNHLYRMGQLSFPNVVYKTQNIKKIKPEGDLYGKLADKPFVVNTLNADSSAIIFSDKHLLRYRVHSGQDTNNEKNGPFYDEIINHNNFFKNIIYNNFYSKILYNLVCYDRLKMGYEMGHDKTKTLREFVDTAKRRGSSCPLCDVMNSKLNLTAKLVVKFKRFFKPKCTHIRVEAL